MPHVKKIEFHILKMLQVYQLTATKRQENEDDQVNEEDDQVNEEGYYGILRKER